MKQVGRGTNSLCREDRLVKKKERHTRKKPDRNFAVTGRAAAAAAAAAAALLDGDDDNDDDTP